MTRLTEKTPGDAATRIKLVARRLFSSRGIDGVTVREIARAAGQKNHSAVGYHFGSKEALIREIILDGAELIDRRRNRMLDEIEAAGGPHSVREIVDTLIYPSIGLSEDGHHEDSYVSFLNLLVTTHRDFFEETLAKRWNSGYLRALEHLRKLMPPMPVAAQNQRFVFLAAIFGEVMGMRERALADSVHAHPTWSADRTLEHFALVMTALLEAPLDQKLAAQFRVNGEEAGIHAA